MHEYSIASALLGLAEEQVRKHEASRVVHLEVRIGELSGVEPPLLETAWSLVRERSVCEGVELTLKRVAARWECRDCRVEILRGAVLRCAVCGGPAVLLEGDELVLDRVEMEVDDV